jgi:hypothetical protein
MGAPVSGLTPAVKQALMTIRVRIEAAIALIKRHAAALAKAQIDLSKVSHDIDVAIKAGDKKALLLAATRMTVLQKAILAATVAMNHAHAELVKEQANFAKFAGH